MTKSATLYKGKFTEKDIIFTRVWAIWKRWSGHFSSYKAGKDTTTYCIGDKLQFEVIKF